MKLQQLKYWLPVLLLTAYAFSESFLVISGKQMDLFAAVFRKVNEEYVDAPSGTILLKKGIDGMCKELDPYTVLFTENEITDYRLRTKGKYGGVGLNIENIGEDIVVTELLEGQAAAKAGIKIGDKIIQVAGISAAHRKVEDISPLISGAPGTFVQLDIQRSGLSSSKHFEILREEVKMNSVPYYKLLNGDIAYLQLNGFTENCSRDVADALQKMNKTAPLKGIIIDLRDNGGGLLDEAVKIVGFFVPKGTLVVTMKGKIPDARQTHRTPSEPIYPNTPLSILINGHSASASEIVAGALQDLDRAILVGEKSYGKGLVQVTKPLSMGNQIKVTIAKYYIPSGRCIQKLDYVHRDAEGKAIAKKENDKKEFFTLVNKRKVLEGGGIDPDINMATYDNNASLKQLLESHLNAAFIGYYQANEIVSEDTLAQPQISEQTWSSYLNYLAMHEKLFQSSYSSSIKKIDGISSSEHWTEAQQKEWTKIKSQLAYNPKKFASNNKALLQKILKKDILSALKGGAAAQAFWVLEDPVLQESMKLISQESAFNNFFKR